MIPGSLSVGASPSSSTCLLWMMHIPLLLLSMPSSRFLVLIQAQPSPALYYSHQLVDHVNKIPDTGPYHGKEWTQRYYLSDKYFQGPGHPIIVIMGGEGDIPPETGFKYPFVTEHLAKSFGAIVVQPEHRFYGESQPLAEGGGVVVAPTTKTTTPPTPTTGSSHNHNTNETDPRVTLFTSEQAIYDAMTLVSLIQNQTHCSLDKFSQHYCPVITVGGSYPGFLAAFARILVPHRVDMAYAASAPMKFYSQQVDQYAYYNHITKVAEDTLTGCATAIQQSLQTVQEILLNPPPPESESQEAFDTARLGICPGSVPNYIAPLTTSKGRLQLAQEVMMVVGYTFANDNMANYPPNNNNNSSNDDNNNKTTTNLYQDCKIFTNCSRHPLQQLREFLVSRLASPSDTDTDPPCWDMSLQLPTGPNATISSGDWSGVGTGGNGESWDFQTCTLLVEAIGFAPSSMFPPRDWSLDWLTNHCQVRFGATPQPCQLVTQWNFTEAGLVAHEVTRILFTNGLQDGWSVGGIQSNLSESLIAMNFPNGAHHSDLSHVGPTEEDSDDIKQGFQDIQALLSKWLDEIRPIEREGKDEAQRQ
jgi:hypothetical protein